MRFVIGLKLGEEDAGALALCGWMRSRSPDAAFLPEHTVEFGSRSMDPGMQYQIDSGARRAVEDAFAQIGIDEVATHIAPEGRAEENLAKTASTHAVDAIIVGRRARTEERRLIRLGPVARRLLRSLPVPVVIGAPDLASAGVGQGPVMLALDGETDAGKAAAFARTFAELVDRELVVAHVTPSPAQVAAPYVPTSIWKAAVQEAAERAEAGLAKQRKELGLTDHALHTTEGTPVQGLTDLATDASACMVVCSSRQLSTADRIFESSAASSLAAAAPFPVAVVPND